MHEVNSSMYSIAQWQLPKTIIPTRYNLSLRPDLDHLTVDGRVDISIQVRELSNNITLHSKNLDIYQVRLTNTEHSDPVYFTATDIKYNETLSTVNLIFSKNITIGDDFRLSMDFRGNISTQAREGFYSSNLIKDNNQTRVISTQFEPSSARLAFPCWDEPGYKTTFDVMLDVPKNLTAISNNEVNRIDEINDRKRYFYKTTPLMSTYTLAFAVGDLEYIEGEAVGYQRETPVKCRLYTLRGYSKQAQDGLDALIKSLNFFEEYFGILYQLSKLDMLAVPQLAPAAMENWGLITMGHHSLMTGEPTYTESQLKFTRIVIIHEVAHQWFGNLVTMQWWNDLWLNEAFASYFEVIAGRAIYPDYNLNDWIYSKYLGRLLRYKEDVLKPIRDADANSYIVYGKGAAVLSILSNLVSESNFKKALQTYLSQNQLKNTVSSDFHSVIPIVTGFNSTHFEETWIESRNHPYLNIAESKKNNALELTISQTPLLLEYQQPIWDIPIDVILDNKVNETIRINLVDQNYTVAIPEGINYKVKTNSFGLIKPIYSAAFFQRNTNLNSPFYDLQDLYEIIDGTILMIDIGKESHSLVLDLLSSFKSTKNLQLIHTIRNRIYTIIRPWLYIPEFNQFFNTIQASWYKDFDSRSILSNSTVGGPERDSIILFRALQGDELVLNSANAAFHEFIKRNQTGVPEPMLYSLLRTVLTQEDPIYITTLLPLIESNLKLASVIVASLSYSHPTHLPTITKWLQNQNPERLMQFIGNLQPVQPYPTLVWQLIESRWSTWSSDQTIPLPYIISRLLSYLILPRDIDPIFKFLESHPSPGIQSLLDNFSKRSQLYQRALPSMMAKLDQLNRASNVLLDKLK